MSGEATKTKKWMDGLLSIPFGKLVPPPLSVLQKVYGGDVGAYERDIRMGPRSGSRARRAAAGGREGDIMKRSSELTSKMNSEIR